MMKRYLSVLMLLCLLLTAKADPAPESVEEAISWVKENAVVVLENTGCTAGQAIWDEFVGKVEAGQPADVLCAHIYDLDIQMEPVLYFVTLNYDGERFTVSSRNCMEEEAEEAREFLYLRHFTGDAPAQALYARYEYYVLVNQEVESWEEIERGMLSSRWGDAIDHFTMYWNRQG